MKKAKVKTNPIPVLFIDDNIPFPKVDTDLVITDIVDVAVLSSTENANRRVFVLPIAVKDDYRASETPDEAATNGEALLLENVRKTGVVCEIINIKHSAEREFVVTFRGICKAKINEYDTDSDNAPGIVVAGLMPIFEPELTDDEVKLATVYKRNIVKLYRQFQAKKPAIGETPESVSTFLKIRDFDEFAYAVCSTLDLDPSMQEDFINCENVIERLALLEKYVSNELEFVSIQLKILEKASNNLSQQQKEVFMREQIHVIEEELGDDESGDYNELKKLLEANKPYMSLSTFEKLGKELDRMRRLSSMSADYPVSRQHLDFLLNLPWKKTEQQPIELVKIREILDRDHYGLEKVKDRIVEFMAVKTMKNATANGTICLFGPPGTGKTSIAKSISEALGREYVRISLGGVRDEAEIRGHRKTYVGAMAGRILTAIEKAKTNNPVILLDEIDKLCGDFRGDPASALLEVLDREQNKEFVDTYAEVPFDLSDVLFITTANTLDTIPSPLLDRLEVIELSSYTEREKIEIAKRHLIPKQIKEHGVTKTAVKIKDDAIVKLINEYTCEAGVRSLERQIAALIRKAICTIKTDGVKSVTINGEKLVGMLGAGRAIHRFDTDEKTTAVGMVNGLAWTSVGGVLLNVQVNVLEGGGKLEITGLIGDVMKESATAALSYIRSKYSEFGLPVDFYKTKDIHIHVPEGATPKDGPSAGVTITTAIVSALTNTPVRQSVAMTGETTIRGEVLAIGGLKEKTLAALKEGIKTVIVPAENIADVKELPEAVTNGMEIKMVKNIDEVLRIALAGKIGE